MNQPAPAAEIPVAILRDDGDLIAVDKPSGVVVHRGWNSRDRPMLQRVRDHAGQRVHLVHRLDRATSGVLLFTRTPELAARVGIAFEEGRVRKSYLALVRGHLGRRWPESQASAGLVIDHPVPRSEHGERIEAKTRVWCLGESANDRCSLVRAEPLTGRLHQIRRHLKHLAHPVVGDVRYGDGRVNRHFRAQYRLDRLWLHAAALELDELRIEAPLPAPLESMLVALDLVYAAEPARHASASAASSR